MNENGLNLIKAAVKNYPHEFVGVIPFSRNIEPSQKTIDVIPYGSTLMTTIGLNLGWKGLYFDLGKFNYFTSAQNRNDMLNSDAFIGDALKAIDYAELYSGRDLFIRPSDDLKQFSGQVMPADEICIFLKDAIECESEGSYKMLANTKIVISLVKKISAEWRWFIVGGKIVSGAIYMAHGQRLNRIETEKSVILEAQQMAEKWLPHENCVMDLALVENKLKVVEFNCINSSGFYGHDVNAIFKALWEYNN